MKTTKDKKTNVPQANKQYQGVDKNPAEEKGKGEPVTKNDLKNKTVDRVIKEKQGQ